MKKDRYFMARLLSGEDQASVLEKEAILARVLEGSRNEQRVSLRKKLGTWRVAWAVALPTTALVLMGLLFFRPPAESQFQSRTAAAEGAHLSLFCLHDNQPGSCELGSTLIVEVTANDRLQYLAAFAKSPDGAVIWYLPTSETGSSIRIDDERERGFLKQGFLLDEEHSQGVYRVFGVFSVEPLSRPQIRSLFDDRAAGDDGTVEIVERVLELE